MSLPKGRPPLTVVGGVREKARRIRASKYEVNAEVVHVSKGAWVIDFGVLAYQQSQPPAMIREGMWLEAEIDLGIDPFFYFEDLAHVKGMPALIYTWHIQKIGLETAPFIETQDARGTRIMIRDEAKSAFREVEHTNAWADDNGHAEYVLHCTLVSRPPMRSRHS